MLTRKENEYLKAHEQLKMNRISNADLVCVDCVFKLDDTKVYGNTSKCKIFNLKPNDILNGGKCVAYRKES